MDVSRRFFLIGTASVLASSALPFPTPAIHGTLDPRFGFRRVFDITIGFMGPYDGQQSACIGMRRLGDKEEEFSQTIGVRSVFRWVAIPGHEKTLVDRPIVISCVPAIDGAVIDLLSNMERNPGKKKRVFVERYEMRDGQFAAMHPALPLDPIDDEWAA